jgi:predicted PurR-regulated permease PerM
MWPGSSPSAIVNGAAGMIIAALLITGLYEGRDLLIPLALAGLLSFILAPLVHRLEYWGAPTAPAVALVLVTLLGLMAGGAVIIGHEVAQLLEELPKHEANLRDKVRFVQTQFGGEGIWQRAAATVENIEQEVREPQAAKKPVTVEVAQGGSTVTTLMEYTRASVPSLVTGFLALLLTVFILLQYRDLRDRAVRLMGTAEMGRSTEALNDAGTDVAHFLLLQTIVNGSFGLITGIALWLIGIPSPALWGAMAAVMRFVPYVGSFASAIFPLALAAMLDPGWGMLTKTAAVFLVVEPAMGQIVEPLLFGHQTRLSSLAVLLGTAFWLLLWGPVGLVLAVPLTLAIVVLGQHLPHLEFLRVLLGNEPALEPHEHLYHQLLAGEAVLAAKDADRWLGEHTFTSYLDTVAIPMLGAASDDERRAIFGRDRMNEFLETVAEYIGLVQESLEYKREKEQEKEKDTGTAPRGNAALDSSSALVIGGRGRLDHAASQLVADALRAEHGIVVRCPSLGGLTGISAAAEAEQDAHPDVVALVSVGAVTPGQLDLLLRRLKSTFAGSQTVVGYFDDAGESLSERGEGQNVRFVNTVEALIDLVGRTARERAHAGDKLRSLEPAAVA